MLPSEALMVWSQRGWHRSKGLPTAVVPLAAREMLQGNKDPHPPVLQGVLHSACATVLALRCYPCRRTRLWPAVIRVC